MQTLCASCGHLREVVSGTGSRFLLCRLSQTDKRFPKYPPQPVVQCDGYQVGQSAGTSHTLEIVPGIVAICRLPADAAIPDWATGAVVSITRTADELSIVCSGDRVPDGVTHETPWRCLRVVGPLDVSMVGVIASLTASLAASNVSVFVISSFDTDYLLVKESDLETAIDSLQAAGHVISGEE